jgi:DNA invertase Pin-like site-specific DNA recombinase
MDTMTPQGQFLFNVFGALAQYERALTKERIMGGLSAANKRGKKRGRPKDISEEKLQAILEAINSGLSKAAICRTFNVKRTTLYDAIAKSTESAASLSMLLLAPP